MEPVGSGELGADGQFLAAHLERSLASSRGPRVDRRHAVAAQAPKPWAPASK